VRHVLEVEAADWANATGGKPPRADRACLLCGLAGARLQRQLDERDRQDKLAGWRRLCEDIAEHADGVTDPRAFVEMCVGNYERQDWRP